MAVQTAVSVVIGAELGGSFKGAFGSVQKQLGTLGNAIKGLNSTSANIKSFKALGKDTLEARREWKSAEAEVAKLAQAIRATDNPSKSLQANFRNAKKEAALAKSAYKQNSTALSQMSATLKTAGIDTKNLTAEQTRLGKALDTLRARQTALAAIESKKQANLANRAVYRSQIMDVVALGGTLYGMIQPAVAFESAMADVKKVVDFENDGQIREMEQDIKNLSKTIPLSLDGLAAIVAAGGQLGIPREHLAGFAETAAKMSVAMDMSADEAGQAMAKMSNVLNTPIDQMGKVGDVINHLSNNMAATGPEIVEVALRAGAMSKSFGMTNNEVAALGATFVSLGKSPEIAGTAINMMASRLKLLPTKGKEANKMMKQLGISMKDYTKLIESGQGQEALLMVLEDLQKVQGVKRADIMNKLFGENAQRHVNSLVEGLDKYKENLKLVANETDYAGSMQREFMARSATTENNIQLLKNQMAVLATNVGSTLLPAINSVVGIFGKAAGTLADFAEKHPTLIKYIGLAVAGMASMKIATFGLGYGFTFLKGGVLSIMGIFTQARTVFSLLRLGIGGLIPIIKAVGMAFLTNPIGLVITAIAAGAFLVIKYWKPISAFFKNLFAPVVAVFKQVWSWVSGLWEKAQNIFQGIKEWVKDSWVGKAWNWAFGGDDEENDKPAPPKLGESVAEDFSAVSSNVVELPNSSVSTSTSQSSVSVNAPITINTSPGMSAEEVAKQVSKELDAREQTAARRQRGVNYD
ncbi:MAG: phage tail tape measure protein [Alphaproteobacteria bacterium]|nr:phage tail tape measure protein [Alphaproteobacteria bacterium]